MSVQESTTVNAPIDRVVEAYASEDFARFTCDKLRISFENFSVSGETAGAFTATTTRAVSAERIPDIAKKFISKGVQMTQEDSISAPAADGSRTVSSQIKVNGLPITAKATQQLSAQGEKTQVLVSGDVNCGIPLVGKKLAAAAEPHIGKVLSRLGLYVEEWVSKN